MAIIDSWKDLPSWVAVNCQRTATQSPPWTITSISKFTDGANDAGTASNDLLACEFVATGPAAAAGRRPAASDERPLHSGDGIRQFGAAAGQPEYLAWLLSLPTLERERLLGGNWKTRFRWCSRRTGRMAAPDRRRISARWRAHHSRRKAAQPSDCLIRTLFCGIRLDALCA